MPNESDNPTFLNDAFISYSRKDREFAAKLEKALNNYKPPKGLNLPRRNLVVFRDEEDFTGVEYHASLDEPYSPICSDLPYPKDCGEKAKAE